jgi:hypothetical protein
MESKKSIKTDYLQSQTKSENQTNPRKSRTSSNPKNPRISWILSAVLRVSGFLKDSEFLEFRDC